MPMWPRILPSPGRPRVRRVSVRTRMVDGTGDDVTMGEAGALRVAVRRRWRRWPRTQWQYRGEAAGGNGRGGRPEPEPSDSLRTFGAVVQALGSTQVSAARSSPPWSGSRSTRSPRSNRGAGCRTAAFVERAEEVYRSATRGPCGGRAAPVAAAGLAVGSGSGRGWRRTRILYTYECRLIPGLLQTEAYARAVSCVPPAAPDPETTRTRLDGATGTAGPLAVTERPNCVQLHPRRAPVLSGGRVGRR